MELKTMSASEIQQELKKQNYFAKLEVALAIRNAVILGKPILLEGPPGVGKTELAKAVASLMGTQMIRLQCTPEMDEKRALYDFNYAKQMLFVQILKDQVTESVTGQGAKEAISTIDQENPFYSESFLIKRPILEAFLSDTQKVLLIDELDKAEAEFEYSLLEAFSDYTVSIPEMGTVQAKTKPITIVTSNRARTLSDTFKRRCLYLYLDYPSLEEETEIIVTKANANEKLAKQIATLVQKIRTKNVVQAPSTAEAIEWATVLAIHCMDEATKEELIESVSIVAKNQADAKKVVDLIEAS